MKKILLGFALLFAAYDSFSAINSSTYPMVEKNNASLLIASGARTQRLNSGSDNPSSSVSIGFNFVFDGTTYSNIIIGEDGWIKLGGSYANSQSSNDLFSNNNTPKIAPFWDHLKFASNTNGGGAYTFVNGSAPSRVFVVEWVIRRNEESSSMAKVQVALYEGSNNIQFFYQGLNPSSGSIYNDYSIGISNRINSTSNQAVITVSTTNNSSTVSYTQSNNQNSAKIPDTRSYLFTSGVVTFTPSSNLQFTNVTTNQIGITFTGGTGPNHLVLCKAGSAISTMPVNGTAYTANTVYGSGSAIGGAYVVYNGTGGAVTVTGLQASTSYYFMVIEQTGSGSAVTFTTNQVLADYFGTKAIPPSNPPAASSFGSTSATSLNFSCQKGNGQRRIVVCQKDNETTSNPKDNHQYSASENFGEGEEYENGFVVYDGEDDHFTVRNLEGGAKYHFTVVEYNGTGKSSTYDSDHKYKCENTTNAAPPSAPSGSAVFGELSSDAIHVSFTKGDGARRIVICKKGSSSDDDAEDGKKYKADSVFGRGDGFGAGYVIYDGTDDHCRVKGLDQNSTYHFSVIEYNGDNDKTSYDNKNKYKCSASTPKHDEDQDGVPDDEDEFPNDQHRCYTTNYPASGFGTLMFEDLWPGKGDYDFNDLVVDYRYTTTTNAANNVVEVSYTFVTRAVGGSLHNGFAFQLDGINSNKITSVTGSNTHGAAWISLNANGTEAGHATHTNILVHDDAYKLFTLQSGFSFINTNPDAPYYGTDTTRILVKFINNGVAPSGGTLSASALPATVFNPYIIVGQDRGKEVHLMNRMPSAKVNPAYFGTMQDVSSAAQGKYYLTNTNLPWALNVVNSIPFAKEKTDFSEAYLNFINWATSGGTRNTDWYLNLSGNRDTNKLINK